MANPTSSKFCAKCGEALPANAAFCSTCGTPTRAGSGQATPAPSGHGSKPLIAGVVVAAFLAVGLVAWLRIGGESTQSERAVPGAPSNPTRANGKNMPEGHPPIELPKEVTDFLDQLTAKAKAAPNDVEAWQQLARARYRAGQLNPSYNASASEALDHLLSIDPNNGEALRTYGNLAYNERDFTKAESYFRRYLAIDPSDPGVGTDLGTTLLFQGKKAEAAKIYRDVIARNPEFVSAHFNLALALHADGNRDEAISELKTARKLATDDDQRNTIDRYLKIVETGEMPGAEADAGSQGSDEQATPPAAAGSNASTDFQRAVDGILTSHTIVGPRITRIDWTGNATARVYLHAFPMDKMPAVVRNKFKSMMNEQIAALAQKDGVKDDISIELADDENDNVMDRLDGHELVGAFDASSYE